VADDSDKYVDDPSIPSTALLWRRVPPWHYKFDGNVNDYRPSTAAFEDDMDGNPMSAYLADECADPNKALEDHEGFGLVSFPVQLARERGLMVVRKETPGPRGHVLVVGKKTDGIRKNLKRRCEWVVRPVQAPTTEG
jgi:hypothetical protein